MSTYNTGIFTLVPPNSQRILEIGCSDGALGFALKNREDLKQCFIAGIELSPDQAKRAGEVLNEVHAADAEIFDYAVFRESFDVLIFADSLEHMKDPSKLLDRISPVLNPQATVLISVPNLRHLYVMDLLLNGKWDYTERGLLDKTHHHFFTLRTITALLQEKKFNIQKIVQVANDADWLDRIIAPHRLSPEIRERLSLLHDSVNKQKKSVPLLETWFPGYKFTEQDAVEFISAQFLVKAKKV